MQRLTLFSVCAMIGVIFGASHALAENKPESSVPLYYLYPDLQETKGMKPVLEGETGRLPKNTEQKKSKLPIKPLQKQTFTPQSSYSEKIETPKPVIENIVDDPKPVTEMQKPQGMAAIEAEKPQYSLSSDSGGLSLVFENYQFDLTKDMKAQLNTSILAQLKEDANRTLLIQSYASKIRGKSSQSKRRALDRGLALRAYLIEQNIASNRIDLTIPDDEEDSTDRLDITILYP